MTSRCPKRPSFDSEAVYRITVLGRLDSSWSERLGDMTITTGLNPDSEATTVLVGTLLDQAALTGVLNTLYEIGLTLCSVECLGEGGAQRG